MPKHGTYYGTQAQQFSNSVILKLSDLPALPTSCPQVSLVGTSEMPEETRLKKIWHEVFSFV